MIEVDVRRALLQLAREALEARVRGDRLPASPPQLALPMSGLFVTIHCAGDLRGCLGTLDDHQLLGESLVRLAADVACEDPRFRPLSIDELTLVTIDSAASPPSTNGSCSATPSPG